MNKNEADISTITTINFIITITWHFRSLVIITSRYELNKGVSIIFYNIRVIFGNISVEILLGTESEVKWHSLKSSLHSSGIVLLITAEITRSVTTSKVTYSNYFIFVLTK